jgi:hypothetical protein
VEGNSLSATERMTGTWRKPITRLLVQVGAGCGRLHDGLMRRLHCSVLELDEIWSFVKKKEARVQPEDPEEYGDAYTFVAMDVASKLIPSYRVAKRTPPHFNAFALDLSGYTKPWNGFSTGLTLTNLNRPKITVDSESDEFRPAARMGLAYRAPRDRFIVALDMNKTERQGLYYTTGLEYSPTPLLSLRTGWDEKNAVTAGMGFGFRYLKFDYAFSTQRDLGDYNKVSLTWRWGNVYQAQIDPEGIVKETESIYLEGLRNELKFRTNVPKFRVHRYVLAITDAMGKPVRTLSEQFSPPSVILWDMTDEGGRPVKRGKYKFLFRVEYKNGKMWEERGGFRLDYKTNQVPDVEIRMKGDTEGLEGADAATPPAETTPPPAPPQTPGLMEVPKEADTSQSQGAPTTAGPVTGETAPTPAR